MVHGTNITRHEYGNDTRGEDVDCSMKTEGDSELSSGVRPTPFVSSNENFDAIWVAFPFNFAIYSRRIPKRKRNINAIR